MSRSSRVKDRADRVARTILGKDKKSAPKSPADKAFPATSQRLVQLRRDFTAKKRKP